MQIEDGGDDCAVEKLKREDDFMQIDFWCDCDNGIDRFEEEDNTDGWLVDDAVLDCDAIDMQIEEEGDNCALERLKGEEDFLQIDSWCDCDNGIDKFEEEDNADG